MNQTMVTKAAPGQGFASPALSTTIDRATLDQPSCPACYRPLHRRGIYCAGCRASGAAKRHQANREREQGPTLVVAGARLPAEARPRRWRTVTEEVVRGELARFVAEHGYTPSSTEWKQKGMRPSQSSIYRVYGSWTAALHDAGLRGAA